MRSTRGSGNSMEPLLEIRDLRTHFFTDGGVALAVDGVSFSIGRGETVGLVGESGCGKSVTALSILRLVPSPPGRIAGGKILFEGEDLLALPESEMRRVRGHRIAMIFQEPQTSLNPVFRIGEQIIEAIALRRGADPEEAWSQAVEMLRRAGFPSPEEGMRRYPHELSGGMRQRAMIAMALAGRPALLLADEPTTALDVTIQAQILDLLRDLQREYGMSILLITHNLGVVAQIASRVIVMYAGKVVEEAAIRDLFRAPKHPYTIGLFRSIPDLNIGRKVLDAIPGSVPDAKDFPSGCRFHPRCPRATEICREREPALEDAGGGHACACWHQG